MPTGEAVRLKDLVVVEVAEPFWHHYSGRRAGLDALRTIPVGPTEFNPASGGRLAARHATPPRRMYYGSVSPSGALWETLLRDVLGEAGMAAIAREQVAHARLVRVQPTRPLHLIDLRPLAARSIAATPAVLEEIAEVRQTSHYAPTHALAAELLACADAQQIAVDGVLWVSKQDGQSLVYLLYAPPTDEGELAVIEGPIALDDDAAGWAPIDAALALANLTRVTASDDLSEEPAGAQEPRA